MQAFPWMPQQRKFTAKKQADPKEAKSLVDQMKRIGSQVRGLFEEIHFYSNLRESNPSPRLTNEQIREVIVSGNPPWGGQVGDTSLLYWGQQYFELSENLERNLEEAPQLIDCWYRLEWWIEELLENIKVAQSKESEPTIHASFRGLMKRHALSHLGSGRWFLLQTEAERFSPLLTRVKGMKKMYVQKLESMI